MSPKSENPVQIEPPSRRTFLQSAAIGAAASLLPSVGAALPSQKSSNFEFEEETVDGLQHSMNSGKLTSRALTETYLNRIAAMDKQGPAVNAIIELNPDALAIADQLDEERKKKGARGPLHGIPVLIKDNIDTADKMMTTAGSLALVGQHAPKDAFIAQKLRAAGAVILGKTNLSEWANIRSSHSSSGWSGRGGLTRNPYALDRNPCGSSSGTGAAVSANFCTLGIGTETDGSVVCPSSTNGLVGIKPTLGLISRSGIIPIAHSQDTAGPMARTVRDAAILLGALAGADPNDQATADSSGHFGADYTKFLDPAGLRGARIGVARKYFGFSDEVDRVFDEILKQMQGAGAVLVDPADLETHGKFDDTELTVLLYELKSDLNAYLKARGPDCPVRSLKEIIEFNEANRTKEMPYFGQDLFVKAEEKGPLTTKEYTDALAANHRLSRNEGIDALMDKHRLDAILAPTGGPAWLTDLVNGDHSGGGSSNASAVAGYPDITVPAGFVFGLPIGVSFFGRAWSEPTLLKIAYGFEQTFKARKPPQFLSGIKY